MASSFLNTSALPAVRPLRGELAPVISELLVSVPHLLHGFSTRSGGRTTAYRRPCSEAGELNLGFTNSDTRETVLANRETLVRGIFGQPLPLVTLRQIHSDITYRVGRSEATEQAILKGDGLMTDEPGVVLGIMTADCVPVMVADRRRGAVAVFHAGWRGTVHRIVQGGIGLMRMEFGSTPEDLVAAIGPAIGLCCYSVGEEVEQAFHSQFAYASDLFREARDEAASADPVRQKYPALFQSQRTPGSDASALHVDLHEANRRQLLDAGLKPEAIQVLSLCTSCRTDLFFSHRAEKGFTGRMLSVIGTTGSRSTI